MQSSSQFMDTVSDGIKTAAVVSEVIENVATPEILLRNSASTPSALFLSAENTKVNGVNAHLKIPAKPRARPAAKRSAPKKAPANAAAQSTADGAPAKPPRKRSPRVRTTSASSTASQASTNNPNFTVSNTPLSIFQTAFATSVAQPAAMVPASALQLRGARTILPKPPGGQVPPVVRAVAPVANASPAPQLSAPSVSNVPSSAFPNETMVNSLNLQTPVLLGGQTLTFGGMQLMNSVQLQQQKVSTEKATETNAKTHNVAQQTLRAAAPTVQVQLQTIQTPNGPMTVAFLPNNMNVAQHGLSLNSNGPRLHFMPTNSAPNQFPTGLNALPANIASLLASNSLQLPGFTPNDLANSASSLGHSGNINEGDTGSQEDQATSEPLEKKQKFDSDFNLDEFLTFGTAPVGSEMTASQSNVLDSTAQSILDELVTGPMFQSHTANTTLMSSVPLAPVKKKRAPRPRKKKEEQKPDDLKMKVEEILKKCGEEMQKEITIIPYMPPPPVSIPYIPPSTVPATSVFPTAPTVSTQSWSTMVTTKPAVSLSPVIPAVPTQQPLVRPVITPKAASKAVPRGQPAPITPLPPPLPQPAKPAKKKTDLALKDEKDVKMLEKLDLKLPFKGMTSSMNRLLPFHLLSEPDPRPELIERENRAFSLVAQSLMDRQRDLHARLARETIAGAAQPVSSLDILSCVKTWLDSEREEFEAEKRAAAEGLPLDPPKWVFTDLQHDPNVPYYDEHYLSSFAEESFLDEPTSSTSSSSLFSPNITPEPPSDGNTSVKSETGASSITTTPQPGKIKLFIKRPKEPKSEITDKPPVEPAKKISLKLRMSANQWIAVSKKQEPNEPDSGFAEKPPAPLEDKATQNAVDSILQLNKEDSITVVIAHEESKSTARPGSLMRQPVMSNGAAFLDYFYGSNTFSENDTEDPGLDEAIQSILS